ncbi:hypothetical protein APHAL10511_007103 [Amanita phalloides]|nr:hypothetical protein APHAL10511_007103 [Amanita phalloides]
MGWLSSLFTTDRQRRHALSTTHDAFELPTTSPSTTSYTYPPTALLPLHSPAFPPLHSTWHRLRLWLDREYPELGDTLNYGILPEDLANIEMQLGFALPSVVRESYLCVDGQEAESAAGCPEGLFFGLTLLPLEDVLEEWRFWREVDDDPHTGANASLRDRMESVPPGCVRREYSHRGWIPLIADKAGNYVGVDLNPDQSGAVGQVIVFGRDFDTKVVLYPGDGPAGWAKWLASFVEDLEAGDGYELGRGETSDDSEDDVGYESYFHDGNGRGQGDGGGDNGTGGGLRLAGEYKGWNVMEAWADKSIRKWHEAGVIENPKGKEMSKSGVLAEVDAAVEPEPPQPSEKRKTVSVVPAPAPVDLPTAGDITAGDGGSETTDESVV